MRIIRYKMYWALLILAVVLYLLSFYFIYIQIKSNEINIINIMIIIGFQLQAYSIFINTMIRLRVPYLIIHNDSIVFLGSRKSPRFVNIGEIDKIEMTKTHNFIIGKEKISISVEIMNKLDAEYFISFIQKSGIEIMIKNYV